MHRDAISLNADEIVAPFLDYDLQDLIDLDKLQSLLRRFNLATGYPVAILDPLGRVLVAVGWQRICKEFHRAHPATCQLCRESDAYILSNLNTGRCVEYKCRNGLWDIAVPISGQGTHLATLFIGQFFYDDEAVDLEDFRHRAEIHGFEQAEYLAAVAAVPRYSRQQVRAMVAFCTEFAEFIVDLAMSRAEVLSANLVLEAKVAERTIALQKSEERFRGIVESMPVMVSAFDEQGRIVFWNRACERITGYLSDEVLHSPDILARLYPDADYRRHVMEMLRNRRADFAGRELVLSCRDGSQRVIAWTRLSRQAPIPGWNSWAVGEDVTERRRADLNLRRERDLFKSTIESLPGIFYLISAEHRFVQWNQNLSQLSGYADSEIAGMSPLDFFDADEKEAVAEQIQRVFSTGSGGLEAGFVSKDGDARPFAFSALRTWIDERPHLIGVGLDISARRQAENRLAAEQKRLFAVLEALPAYVYLQARDYSIRFANRYFRERFGEEIGMPCHQILWRRDRPCEECPTFRVFDDGQPQQWEWERAPDGRTYQVFDYPFTDNDGESLVLELGIDITDRKRLENQLKELATTDELTGVANRRHFYVLARREMERGRRLRQHCCALMIDADLFKRVNDSLGHSAGDRVLQLLATTLSGGLRTADLIGRYGGEEFVVLLPDTGLSEARVIAERLRRRVQRLVVDGLLPIAPDTAAAITVSIGIGLAGGDDPVELDELVARADRALYRAKQGGRNRVESRA